MVCEFHKKVMENRRSNNKFSPSERNSLSEGGKPKLRRHEELLERMREFLPREESPFDSVLPLRFKSVEDISDLEIPVSDFLAPPPLVPPKDLNKGRVLEPSKSFSVGRESRGRALDQGFHDAVMKQKGLPLPGNEFLQDDLFNIKKGSNTFPLNTFDSRESLKKGSFDSREHFKKGSFDSREHFKKGSFDSREHFKKGSFGSFDSREFSKKGSFDSLGYSSMVPSVIVDSGEFLKVVPPVIIDDSHEFSKDAPPVIIDSREFPKLGPPGTFDTVDHPKNGILNEFMPVPKVGVELPIFSNMYDSSKEQSINVRLKSPSLEKVGVELPIFSHMYDSSKEQSKTGLRSHKKGSLEKPLEPPLIVVDDDISDQIEDFEDFQEDLASLKAEPLLKEAKELDFRNNFLKNNKMDNKTASLILVLLGSLSPFLNLSSNGLSPLKEYRKHDLPASIIHIPDLPHKFDSDEIENGILPLGLPGLPIPPVPPEPLVFGKSLNGEGSSSDAEKCNLKYFANKCENFNNGFCFEDTNYPLADIGGLLQGDGNLVSKYAEVVEQSADDLVSFIGKDQEGSFDYSEYNPFTYDESHWFGPEGYICPSNITYGRPVRAINARGEWKYILNDGDFYSQTLRIETCLYTNTPCRMIAPCFKSRCVQKYAYHRLLSFDPCNPSKGLYTEIFRFPSSCSCYTPEFQGIDDILALDLRRKKEKKKQDEELNIELRT